MSEAFKYVFGIWGFGFRIWGLSLLWKWRDRSPGLCMDVKELDERPW